jgi:predicted DNA-binding transcriptional regulator AlpA
VPRSRARNVRQHRKPEPLATQEEVAEYLRVPPSTLEQWRWRKTGPKWSKVGRYVRYDWADVEQWFAEQSSQGAA